MSHEIIAECAENFGVAPRQFGLWDRLTYLRFARPCWLADDPTDLVQAIFEGLPRLWREGRVVWGHFVQANRLLYAPGDDDCPAEVVYSLDDAATPEELAKIAGNLYGLKGTHPHDPKLAPIAEYLTNEYMRVFGLAVPPTVSPHFVSKISTVYVARKHLPRPERCIRGRVLPVVVSPAAPHLATPLPERYWPASMNEYWQAARWSPVRQA